MTRTGYVTPATQTKIIVKDKKAEFSFVLKRVQEVPVKVRILPDPLNVAHTGYFISVVTLPNPYKAANVDASSVVCEGSPALKLVRLKLFPQTFMAIFSREKLVNVNPGDHIKFTVIGTINQNGQLTGFNGSDTIRVTNSFSRTKETTDDIMKMADGTIFNQFIREA